MSQDRTAWYWFPALGEVREDARITTADGQSARLAARLVRDACAAQTLQEAALPTILAIQIGTDDPVSWWVEVEYDPVFEASRMTPTLGVWRMQSHTPQCPICQQAVTDGDAIVVTPSGVVYHATCHRRQRAPR